jgi:carbamoyltransferase
MTNNKFSDLFGIKVRKKEDDDLKQIHMDIAASIQSVIDETMIRITRNLHDEYKINNLCLAGGVALNCVSNSKILNNNSFKKIWVQPASGDAGGALGAALSYWHIHLKNKRLIDSNFMKGAYLGPEFSNEEIEAELKNCRASFKKYNEKEIIKKTVEDLENNKAIGWFQGRMEFGPRALGARSIIADPRSKDMQKNLNIKVKFRESFRPFAPSILLEDLENWFNFKHESPYMLFVAEVMESKRKEMEGNSIKKGLEKLYHIRSEIPAVTHVDYSSRIQTVTKKNNERYFELLSQFKKSTGCPILINTSFNVRGEPIVCTPKDAYNCFMGTNLDTLVIGDFYLEKINQHKENLKDYKNLYDLD